MFETIVGLFTSVASGGLTGLLGILFQRGFDAWNKKQEHALKVEEWAHEERSRRIDGELMDKEWGHRTQVATVEAAGRSDVAESQAFAETLTAEPERYSEHVKPGKVGGFLLVLADFIRGIVRPGLTVYLCVLTTLIYFQARDLLDKENLSPEQALAVTRQVIETILYLTTTCLLWWFGTRNKASAPAR